MFFHLNVLKKHWPIFLTGIFLTLLVSLPVILFPFFAHDSYQGINIAHFGTDAHYYLTRGKEILEGHGLGNIILREGKDMQEPQFTYVEYVLLLPLRAFGMSHKIDIVTLYNVYNFIGVLMLILMVYFFALELKDNRWFATAASLFVVGGYSIIYNKTIGSPELNIYGRAIFPYVSSLVFFNFARLLLRSLKYNHWKKTIWAGVSFGVLFYIFFYAWSFALALLGSLFIVYLVKKDFISVKKLVVISSIGLALGAYNLIRLLSFYNSEHGRQLGFFLWSYTSHTPIMSKIGLVMIVVLGVYLYRQRGDSNMAVIIGFMLAGWIALNQQIFSGHVIQYGHYYWFFIVPTSIILSIYMIWSLLKNDRWRIICSVALVLIVFVNSGIGQYRATFTYLDSKKDEQRYRPILTVLQKEQTSSVVMAPDNASGLLITIYTSHDLLWNGTALVYNTPLERMEETLVWYLYLNKESRSTPRPYLEQALANSGNASESKMLYVAIEGLTSGWDSHVYDAKVLSKDFSLFDHRRQLLDRVEKNYRRITADPQYVASFLEKYGVSYIVWDKVFNPEWDLTIFPRLQLLVQSERVGLYIVTQR